MERAIQLNKPVHFLCVYFQGLVDEGVHGEHTFCTMSYLSLTRVNSWTISFFKLDIRSLKYNEVPYAVFKKVDFDSCKNFALKNPHFSMKCIHKSNFCTFL